MPKKTIRTVAAMSLSTMDDSPSINPASPMQNGRVRCLDLERVADDLLEKGKERKRKSNGNGNGRVGKRRW